MRKRTISVTEALRNFSDCVNRAHYHKVTFVLLKNGLPFARLGPETDQVCLGRDLAKALAASKLSQPESRAWRRDLKRARRSLKLPVDKWR